MSDYREVSIDTLAEMVVEIGDLRDENARLRAQFSSQSLVELNRLRAAHIRQSDSIRYLAAETARLRALLRTADYVHLDDVPYGG